jgi:transposase-like protein
VAQHFLLSIAARTLSLSKVMRLSDDLAFETFKSIRWASTEGRPVCPKCGCVESYAITTRKLWKCAGCLAQFSVTSGTIFASRKLPIRDLLAAIAIFVNAAKGHSALQLSRDLNVQYKTAFVLSHKIREALGGAQQAQTLQGEVEVDGAYFGGYVKPANRKVDRVDRRLAMHQTGKRRVVVIMRERHGQSLPFVFKTEGAAVSTIHERAANGATIHADEASHWDGLHARFLTKRQPLRLLQRRRGLHQLGGVVLLPHPSRRSRDAPPHRRQVPPGLCQRNGVARRQPARLQRRPVPSRRGRSAGAPGQPAVEGLLAAGGIAGLHPALVGSGQRSLAQGALLLHLPDDAAHTAADRDDGAVIWRHAPG